MHEVIITPLSAHPVTLELPLVVIPTGVFGGAPPRAIASAVARAPSATAVRVAVVAAVRATTQGVAYAAVPTGLFGGSGNVAAVLAGASSLARSPAVGATSNATVTPPIATATVGAYAPGLGGALSVTSFAPLSSSTANAQVPAVSGAATVDAVVATAAGTAIAATVAGTPPSATFAVIAAASATAQAPVVVGGATVNAVRAVAVTDAVDPTTPVVISVAAVRALMFGWTFPPTVTAQTVLTGGGPGLGNAHANPPTSVTGTGGSPPAFASVSAEADIPAGDIIVPVAAGVTGAASQCVMVFLQTLGATTIAPISAGFTAVAGSPQHVTGTDAHDFWIFWKRPTVADTGNYTFSQSGGLNRLFGFSALFTGCVGTGTPVTGTGFVDVDASTTGSPAASISAAANSLAVWAVTNFHGTGITFTGGFTERADDGAMAMATLPKVPAGPVPASGTLVATAGSATQSIAWLGTISST